MPEHEARAVYDHEAEDGHATGRRRAVADWGVGEELFDRMPRRRLRSSEAHRRDAHRGGRFEPAAPPRAADPAPIDAPSPPEIAAPDETAALAADVAAAVEALEQEAAAPAVEPSSPEAVRPPDGRRTVVIRGRGAEPAWTPRRRPPRTVGERVGPRPDRLAAWAVALGMLLILIAVLTAHG